MLNKLIELVRRLDELDPEDVIYARPEWRADSDAAIFRLTDGGHQPDEPRQLGLEYFLEADIAREVLEEFQDRPETTDREKCERLIQYAKYDA